MFSKANKRAMLSTRSMACLLDSSSGVVGSDISIPMHYSVVDLFPYRIPILSFFSDMNCFG
jgi:hypothetical protein